MRLIIRSQLIPIPIIWQLGPVDQHMLFDHFPVVPKSKTSFLPYNGPSPKLLADQWWQAQGEPARQLFYVCVYTHVKTFLKGLLWKQHFKRRHVQKGARESEGQSGKGRTEREQNSSLLMLQSGYGQKSLDQRVKIIAIDLG